MEQLKKGAPILVVGAVCLTVFFLVQREQPATMPTISPSGQPMLPTKIVTFMSTRSMNNTEHPKSPTVVAEVAMTPQQEEAGLSGRASLQEGAGMLFYFTPPRVVGFWMKDMKFSIDMLFVDETGEIVTIESSVAPQSYPTVYRPLRAVSVVLELPAGYAKTNSIAVGDKIVVQ